MSRSRPRARPRASLLATLVAPALACTFSTFGIDLPSGSSTDPGDETTAGTTTAPVTTGTDTGGMSAPTTGEPADTGTTGATAGSTGDAGESTGEPIDCPPPTPIALAETLTLVRDDLATVDPVAVPFTRYLGLVHLYNAGLCDAELDTHRHALNKLLNSLSLEPAIAVPAPIDDRHLLYRIDLRSYAWDRVATASGTNIDYADVWEMLAARDPHAVAYTGELAAELTAATGTDYPLLRADAVLRHGATAPLYYDILGLPLARQTLETVLGVDTTAGIAQERSGAEIGKVGRAALHDSAIAKQHRVIERHAYPKVLGAYWIAYDFLGLSPDTDVFTTPFDWQPDELNVTFNLPNGLQAYVIFAGNGGRRITAQDEILVDPNLPDEIVRAGISCIGCHTHGVQPAEDDLRYEIDQGGGQQFDAVTREEIKRLYPPRSELSQQLDLDRQRFVTTLELLGVPVDLPQEPVLAAYLEYGAPIDLRRAAAELWLAELDHDALLDKLAGLGPELEPLTAEGGEVSREVFTASFPAAICTLGFGRTLACPDP